MVLYVGYEVLSTTFLGLLEKKKKAEKKLSENFRILQKFPKI